MSTHSLAAKRFVVENGLNPWSAPGRAMPPFAPQTFNAWWKKGRGE